MVPAIWRLPLIPLVFAVFKVDAPCEAIVKVIPVPAVGNLEICN